MSENPSQEAIWSAELIDAIGEAVFLDSLKRYLQSAVPHECALFFLYRPDAAPVCLNERTVDAAYREGVRNFLGNTYVLNPFYRAVRRGLAPGLYFMRELIPRDARGPAEDADFRIRADAMEEIGYLTQGWPPGMEELLLALPLTGGALIEVSLSRARHLGGFRQVDLSLLRERFPVLLSTVRKHWALAGDRMAPHPEAPDLERQFEAFGAGLLSDREREIVRLILLGHSSLSIGLILDIALPTVKSHRRNAYAKLGIATQAELFASYLKSVRRAHPLG